MTDNAVTRLLNRRLSRPERILVGALAVAIPVQVWSDAGPLFGIVAALSFTPLMLLGAVAPDWVRRPRRPGPRALAPLGPLPIVPMLFVLAGWLLDWSPAAALAAGVAGYVPLAVLGVLRHPRDVLPD
jgi:hypothetical protein